MPSDWLSLDDLDYGLDIETDYELDVEPESDDTGFLSFDDLDYEIESPEAPTSPAVEDLDDGGLGIQDTLVGVGAGANTLLKIGGDLYGLATGDTDNWASEQGQRGMDYWNGFKSNTLLRLEEERREAIDAADGEWNKFGVTVWETMTSPRLLSNALGEQVPMLMPIAGAGRAAGAVSKFFFPSSSKMAAGAATAGALGTGGLMQGADVGAETFERIMSLKDEIWNADPDFQKLLDEGFDREEAKQRMALSLGRVAGVASFGTSVATNMLPGGRILDRALAGSGKALKGGLVTRAAKGAAGESFQEAAEEGSGKLFGNLGVQQVDPSVSPTEGVGEAAGMGAVVAGPMGAGAGVLSGRSDVTETEEEETTESLREALDALEKEVSGEPFQGDMFDSPTTLEEMGWTPPPTEPPAAPPAAPVVNPDQGDLFNNAAEEKTETESPVRPDTETTPDEGQVEVSETEETTSPEARAKEYGETPPFERDAFFKDYSEEETAKAGRRAKANAESYNVPYLKKVAKALKLKTAGKKAELIDRILDRVIEKDPRNIHGFDMNTMVAWANKQLENTPPITPDTGTAPPITPDTGTAPPITPDTGTAPSEITPEIAAEEVSAPVTPAAKVAKKLDEKGEGKSIPLNPVSEETLADINEATEWHPSDVTEPAQIKELTREQVQAVAEYHDIQGLKWDFEKDEEFSRRFVATKIRETGGELSYKRKQALAEKEKAAAEAPDTTYRQINNPTVRSKYKDVIHSVGSGVDKMWARVEKRMDAIEKEYPNLDGDQSAAAANNAEKSTLEINGTVQDYIDFYAASMEGFNNEMPVNLRQKRGGKTSDVGHKREKTSGRYVGAPDWVQSSAALGKLRRNLRQLAMEGERGKYWYEQSSRAILKMFDGNKTEAEKFVSLIAIYSPNNTVPGNTTAALTAYYQWKAGRPIHAGVESNDKKARALLIDGKAWAGIKTNSFYMNLMVEINPSKVDHEAATMDMWMAIAFDYGMKVLDQGPKYRFAEREVQRLAKELGWKPHQVQAAIWTAMKGRVEPITKEYKAVEIKKGIRERYNDKGKIKDRVIPGKEREHFKLVFKMGMARDLEVEDITASKYDFSNALSDRAAQMSWEAEPGATSGELPGLRNATIEQKFEYLNAIRAALTGKKGEDLIARAVGLVTPANMEGVSAWEGKTGAGVQEFIPVASPLRKTTEVERSEEGGKYPAKARFVKKSAAIMLNRYAALRGYILKQDMVVWHMPIYDDAIKRHNGVELRTSRPLHESEIKEFYQAMYDEFGTWDLAPGYIPNGLRVLNFSEYTGLDNKDFRKRTLKVANNLSEGWGDGVGFASYRSDGDAVFTNWRDDPNGESYRNTFNTGRSDLSRQSAVLRARVEAVNKKFEKKYGWGSETDQQGSQPSTVRQQRPEVNENGEVELTHWSPVADLEILDPNYHGTGIKGAEAKRKANDPTTYVQRLYFGLKGYVKEAFLGKNQYNVTVAPEELYDFTADPDSLVATFPAGTIDLNQYEKNIAEAGYSGYFVNQEGTHVAAMFTPVTIRNQRSGYTDERVRDLLAEWAYPDGRVKAAIAHIDPRDFLRATTDHKLGREQVLDQVRPLDIERLAGESQTPFIYVDETGTGDYRITAHEGRHRMEALANAGVTRVPVVVKAEWASFSRVKETGLPIVGEFLGQNSDPYKDNTFTLDYQNAVDISYDNQSKLKEFFAGETATIRFQRSADVVAKYNRRVDALHRSGAIKSKYDAVPMSESIPVLGLIGEGNYAVVLQEDHAIAQKNHVEMTAADWKAVPKWLEDPIAIFKRPDGSLKVIPRGAKNGQLISIGIRPGEDSIHTVVTAYGYNGRAPLESYVKDDQLKYLNMRYAKMLNDKMGYNLPTTPNDPYMRGVKTERQLSTVRQQRTRLWRSALLDEVAALNLPSATPAQWKKTIQKLQQKGVKQEEIEWSGVMDYLDHAAESVNNVTQADLMEYLEGNSVELEEKILSNQNGPQEIDRDAMYAEWQMDGPKQGYTELLITLPQKESSSRIDENKYPVLGAFANKQASSDTYRSPHWDGLDNVLIHVRFNERQVEGKRTLFVEEIQSDWHQAGRKLGYSSPEDVSPHLITSQGLRKQARTEALNVVRRYDMFGFDFPMEMINASVIEDRAYGEGAWMQATDVSDLSNEELETLQRFINHKVAVRETSESLIPDAPFKKSQVWGMVGMKRAIRWAVDNGYEQVAWTPGEVQNERYNLSTKIRSVYYAQRGENFFVTSVTDINGKMIEVPDSDGTLEHLETIYGKDLVKKMKAGEGKQSGSEEDRKEGFEWKELTGKDLEVGGTGMKGFYDKIMPTAVGKFIKKFGAKVGVSKVSIPGSTPEQRKYRYAESVQVSDEGYEITEYAILSEEGSLVERLPAGTDYLQMKRRLDALNKVEDKGQEVWSFPVTDKMKAAVGEGTVMFQKTGQAQPKQVNPVQTRIDEIKAEVDQLNLKMPVEVIASKNDLPWGDRLEDDATAVWAEFPDGSSKIYVFADAASSAESAVVSAIHEAVGHAGLRSLFTDSNNQFDQKAFDDFLDMVYQAQSGRVAKMNEKKGLGFDMNNEADRREATEEFFAYTAQNLVDKKGARVPDWLTALMVKLKQLLRKMRVPGASTWGRTELLELISEANKAARKTTKITGSDGVPVTIRQARVYQGAPAKFDKHSNSFIGSGTDTHLMGYGHNFASRKEIAQHYKDIAEGQGYLYTVDLTPDETDYLLWHSKLPKQSADVKMFIKPILDFWAARGVTQEEMNEWTGREIYSRAASASTEWVRDQYAQGKISLGMMDNSDALQSGYLLSLGVRGNKGLDHYSLKRRRQMTLSAAFSKDTYNYVVFDESDINIVLRQQRQGRAAAAGATNASLWQRVLDRIDKFRFYMQDKNIEMIRRQVSYGSPLPERQDAYQAVSIFDSLAGERLNRFDEEITQKLLDMIAHTGLSIEQVGEWLVARHASEANAYLYEINPDLGIAPERERLAGMSNREAAAILADHNTNTALQQVGQLVDKINSDSVDQMIADGVLSQDMANNWRRRYQHYVPLQRAEAESESLLLARGEGFSLKGRESQQRTGSAYWNPAHIVANTLQQAQVRIVRGEKNRVARALYEQVLAHPDPDFWKIETNPTHTGVVQRKTAGGIVREVKRDIPDFQLNDNQLGVKVDGNLVIIEFTIGNARAERMVRGLKNLEAPHFGLFTRLASSFTRFLSHVNTSWNPEFIVSNFFRDYQTAAYNLTSTELKNMRLKVLRDTPRAVAGIGRNMMTGNDSAKWSKAWTEFVAAGGKTGWIDLHQDAKVLEKDLQKIVDRIKKGKPQKLLIRRFFDKIDATNTAVENGVRLSAYYWARQPRSEGGAGMTESAAAALAKDLTVNFNRKGVYGPAMNAFYMFYNAAIQGQVRLLRTMVNSKTGRRMAYSTIAFAVMMDLVNRMQAGDDDDGENLYDALPDHVKAHNIIIWGGAGRKEPLVKIPAPWGYNVFHALGQGIGSMVPGMGKKNAKISEELSHVMFAMFDAFNPLGTGDLLQMMSPTVVDPFLQIKANEDWSGKPVKPVQFPTNTPKPESQMFFSSVNPVAKDVAQWLNTVELDAGVFRIKGGTPITPGDLDISPEAIELLVSNLTGGAGRLVTNTSTVLSKLMKGEEIPTAKTPFLRKVTGYDSQYGVKSRYYEWSREVGYQKKEIAAVKGAERIALRQTPEGRLIPKYNSTEKRLTKLRKKRREALERDNQQLVDNIDERIRRTMADFNMLYREQVLGNN